jgi:hypothetical protein
MMRAKMSTGVIRYKRRGKEIVHTFMVPALRNKRFNNFTRPRTSRSSRVRERSVRGGQAVKAK